MRDSKAVRTVTALVLPVAAAVIALCAAGHTASDALFAILKLVVIR